MKSLYRHTLRCLSLAALAALALAAAATTFARGDEVPAWLTQAASASAPAYPREIPGVVLHSERQVTIAADGKTVATETYAVRILRREWRGLAAARESYTPSVGKVRELRAWLIRPSGQVKRYGKDETSDVAASLNDVYNESRVRVIDASADAEEGAVFGYHVVTEEQEMFPVAGWTFQSRLPTLLSRYALTLPAGWTVKSVTFNRAGGVEPTVAGSTYTWELRSLAPLDPEPASPEVTSLAPRIAVNYAPPAGLQGPTARVFADWADVSRWYTDLSDSMSKPDEAIVAKVRELTANAKTELDKIRAIGRYVQELQYISIQIGAGRFRPHSASEVFAKRYGDCKDKANLMRAMLKVWNIESHLVLIYSGDPTFVRAEWASPAQFNHCIIAVRVGPDTKGPTVIEHAQLGRLLIFDATDDNTPVGDLPDHEQNSYALVAAGPAGALLRMPSTPPEANQLDRTADVTLAADGSITASLRERSVGQSAVNERRMFRRMARPDYAQAVQNWITRGATGAKVSKVEPVDGHAEGRFSLDVDFAAAGYGQLMQNRLLIFKPAIVERRESLMLTGGARKHPVVLGSQSYTETVRVTLPAGFDVDELPDAVKLDASFGSYTTTYAVKEGRLHYTRAFVQRASTIPADRYAEVRGFFERIRAAEQSPVVLAKK
jgi:hypothetical protein